MIKMNTLLATVDHKSSVVNGMISDYLKYFKNNQDSFKGSKKTFTPRDGFSDQPDKRGVSQVVATVDEKLDWFEDIMIPYLKDLFSVEATNSRGATKVELKVGEVSFGKLSAIELMRLKNFLTNTNLDSMYKNIPVRTDREVWDKSKDPEYDGREVYESKLISGITRTTTKRQEILTDPNLDRLKDTSKYTPVVTTIDKIEETGDYTSQLFSGEWSQRQRAELLKRKSQLLEAVIGALKEVNDIDTVESELDVDRLVKYINRGTIE